MSFPHVIRISGIFTVRHFENCHINYATRDVIDDDDLFNATVFADTSTFYIWYRNISFKFLLNSQTIAGYLSSIYYKDEGNFLAN